MEGRRLINYTGEELIMLDCRDKDLKGYLHSFISNNKENLLDNGMCIMLDKENLESFISRRYYPEGYITKDIEKTNHFKVNKHDLHIVLYENIELPEEQEDVTYLVDDPSLPSLIFEAVGRTDFAYPSIQIRFIGKEMYGYLGISRVNPEKN